MDARIPKMSVSPEVMILIRAEVEARENAAFQRGAEQGKSESAAAPHQPTSASEWLGENAPWSSAMASLVHSMAIHWLLSMARQGLEDLSVKAIDAAFGSATTYAPIRDAAFQRGVEQGKSEAGLPSTENAMRIVDWSRCGNKEGCDDRHICLADGECHSTKTSLTYNGPRRPDSLLAGAVTLNDKSVEVIARALAGRAQPWQVWETEARTVIAALTKETGR
jgi:hypothetical protein